MSPVKAATQEQSIANMVTVVLSWFGTIVLADIQTIVAILSGIAVLVYTVTNTYVLWRDKVRKSRSFNDVPTTDHANL